MWFQRELSFQQDHWHSALIELQLLANDCFELVDSSAKNALPIWNEKTNKKNRDNLLGADSAESFLSQSEVKIFECLSTLAEGLKKSPEILRLANDLMKGAGSRYAVEKWSHADWDSKLELQEVFFALRGTPVWIHAKKSPFIHRCLRPELISAEWIQPDLVQRPVLCELFTWWIFGFCSRFASQNKALELKWNHPNFEFLISSTSGSL